MLVNRIDTLQYLYVRIIKNNTKSVLIKLDQKIVRTLKIIKNLKGK